jgi:signal transduction histidine kinase
LGSGIPPAQAAQVFNPFFTTKPSGTGLGLAIVHKVVEDHGGTVGLRVGSRGGTTFTVELPLTATRSVAPVPDRPQNAGVPRPRLLS